MINIEFLGRCDTRLVVDVHDIVTVTVAVISFREPNYTFLWKNNSISIAIITLLDSCPIFVLLFQFFFSFFRFSFQSAKKPPVQQIIQ